MNPAQFGYTQANPGAAFNPYGNAGPMMQWGGSGSGLVWIGGVLCVITWVLIIILLISLIRLIWKKGDKVK